MTTGEIVGALDVGGSHVAGTGVCLGSTTVTVPPHTAQLDADGDADTLVGTIAAVADVVADDIRTRYGTGIRRWGIAMPGPFDYVRGIGRFKDVGKFENLAGVDVAGALSAAMTTPPEQLVFLNDADAFALGEWHVGALAGVRRAAALTLGTGIGSCFLADGQVCDDGPDVPVQGEAHLLRVYGQPLEQVASTRALLANYLHEVSSVAEIAQRARSGDAVAAALFEEYGDAIGVALAPFYQRFGVERVVLGGAISASLDLFADALARHWHAVTVVVCADPRRSTLVGAALAL